MDSKHPVEHSSPREAGPNLSMSILCVDDDETIRKSLVRFFRDETFEVITAATGDEGLELLKATENIGLILSDQSMPGMSGTEFLEAAQRLAPDIPRIMLTSSADLEAAVTAINSGGVCRYLAKPWQADELRQTVRDVVEQSSLKRENLRLAEIVSRQNDELVELNASLKKRVLAQTAQLRRKIEEMRHSGPISTEAPTEPVLMAIFRMIETSNEKFYHHSRVVAALSEAMAHFLTLDGTTCQEIKIAALLHDIGFSGFSVLFEYKELNEMNFREKAEFLQHPIRGQVAVTSSQALQGIGQMIRHHHEAYDGSGFPDQLTGESIPLGARIIAIANLAEKICSLQSKERALELVSSRMGKELDPDLKEAFLAACSRVFVEIPKPDATRRELYPQDLVSGLTVCDEVRSGTGVILLEAGTIITDIEVAAMHLYNKIEPFKNKIKVA